eukprot:4915920-Ditylum_brightwellii.AAC.1
MQPAQQGAIYHHTDSGALPNHTQKAKVSTASPIMVCFEGAASGSLPSFGLAPSDPWQKELQQCCLLAHVLFPGNLSSFSDVSFLHAVSDGSHQSYLSETLGSAAWIIETLDEQL